MQVRWTSSPWYKKPKNFTLPQALDWLKPFAGIHEPEKPQTSPMSQTQRIKLLTELFQSFERSFLSSPTGRKYLESRSIAHQNLEVGFNPGTFHHSVNLPKGQEAQLRKHYQQLGLITPSKTGNGYQVFGKGCTVFPLRNAKGKIVSFYYRETNTNKTTQHYYLTNRQGLYPHYPDPSTPKLILTESILDAISLAQVRAIHTNYEILACYGTEGIREQLIALNALEELGEVVLFFDGDQPGRKGAQEVAQSIAKVKPEVNIQIVNTPQDEDINSLIQAGKATQLLSLIENASTFFLSPENKAQANSAFAGEKKKKPQASNDTAPQADTLTLDTSHPQNLTYQGKGAIYTIKGGLGKQLDSLRVSLVIEHKTTKRKSRVKVDLYEDKQVEKVAKEAAEKLKLDRAILLTDLEILTDLVETHREAEQAALESKKEEHIISPEEKKRCIGFLKRKSLIQDLSDLIGKAGIVGEAKNRVFLFCIAASHNMPEPLHALVQGSSGSGKTHLVRQICELMPPERVKRFTRVSSKSFYNYGEYELQFFLIVLEDYDGMNEESEFAWRELQSNGELISSVSAKDEQNGTIQSKEKRVRGPIATLAATTRGEVYEDNMSRVFVIAIDESEAQTDRIIAWQNAKAAGKYDSVKQREIREFLRNCVRLLAPLEVLNPYAESIFLPPDTSQRRRLNELLQAFVKQVTLIHQYQRSRNELGALVSEKADVVTAIDLMFESIVLKVDELDGSLRAFYEKLKAYIEKKDKDYSFTQREIRQAFKLSKTGCQNHINRLVELEYITKKHVGQRNTFHYTISYWDDMAALRARIKKYLYDQLDQLD